MKLNGIFTSVSIHGMVEVEDYHFTDMDFPFICEYVDNATEYLQSIELTKASMIYSELQLESYPKRSKKNRDNKAPV